jgi:integrase
MNDHYPGKYVFPGRNQGQPIKDIRRFWLKVCREAKLNDVRIHDLRHTYASILVSSGSSLSIIGALLGHTQPGTTARYAHLFDDPLKEATNRVGEYLSGSNE